MSIVPISSLAQSAETLPSNKAQKILSRDSDIREVALRALKELAIGLASIALCSQFVAQGSGIVMLMIAISVASVILNSAIHLASLKIKDEEINQFLFNPCRSIIFCFANITNVSILVHEAGHFFCAQKLFDGKHFIQLLPFRGGVTQIFTNLLTPLGQKIGYRYSIFLITLAGPALAILAATVALMGGLIMRHYHPQAGSDLIAVALDSFLNHALYALSALWTSERITSNDFVRLKAFGIDPLVACATIIAIPTVIFIGYLIKEHMNHTSFQKLNPLWQMFK